MAGSSATEDVLFSTIHEMPTFIENIIHVHEMFQVKRRMVALVILVVDSH